MQKKIAKEETLFYEELLKKEINQDREAHEKKPLKDDDNDNPPSSGNESAKEKTIKESTSAPESDWFRKDEHKNVFAMPWRQPAIKMVGFLVTQFIRETCMTVTHSKAFMTKSKTLVTKHW